jgi:hypothetical protein
MKLALAAVLLFTSIVAGAPAKSFSENKSYSKLAATLIAASQPKPDPMLTEQLFLQQLDILQNFA